MWATVERKFVTFYQFHIAVKGLIVVCYIVIYFNEDPQNKITVNKLYKHYAKNDLE